MEKSWGKKKEKKLTENFFFKFEAKQVDSYVIPLRTFSLIVNIPSAVAVKLRWK